MVEFDRLRDIVSSQVEWLLIRETGRSFPLSNNEISVDPDGLIRFLDDGGSHIRELKNFEIDGPEITVELAENSGQPAEFVRLVPRTPASDLAAEVEIARLAKANETADLICQNFPRASILRVALNDHNGRLAQILFEDHQKRHVAAIADITNSLTAESILTTAMLWLEQLGARKKNAVLEICVICEKRQAKGVQKLHAVLSDKWKAKISVFEMEFKNDPPRLRCLAKKKIRDLWREKARKLSLPAANEPRDIGAAIAVLAPEYIDTLHSQNGVTLRYLGLPFARVRSTPNEERAWFGVGRNRTPLTDENWHELETLINALKAYRSAEALNPRHEFYRSASESWLESLLRRDISRLDSNLILSPIYNQFRSTNDKIDLLALRRDGRLVIIELKTQPDREMVFQAADYWRKIEVQRRRGILASADLFGGRKIIDKPALLYLVAPAWSFHRDFEFFAKALAPEIDLWRFELHQDWRRKIKVLARCDYTGSFDGVTKR